MEKKKILNQVVPNDDDYCWKNLTCTYRPWMTGFKSFGQTYEDAFLLLVSFIEIYFDEVEEKRLLDFVENYEQYLESFIGIRIRKHTFRSLREMQSLIINSIDQEQPVLVPCDLIALPYNPMYMLEHRYKCMVVKGYDVKRDLLFIIDNIHIDYGSSTILTDFVSQTAEMYNMNKEISTSLEYEQCCFSLEKVTQEDIRAYTILKKLGELIDQYLLKPEKVIHWEKKLQYLVHKRNMAKPIEEIIKTLDFKYVFRDRLHQLLECLLGNHDKVEKLCTQYDDVCADWLNLRNEILFSEDASIEMSDLQLRIQNAEQKEVLFMKDLAAVIGELPDKAVEEKRLYGKFRVLNNSKAIIQKMENGFEIEHDKGRKYDTWQMQDNACQLLVDHVSNGKFEVKVHSETCFGEDIHSGIIVKLKSGIKYLFGNVRGRIIAIYCPELDDNFELYSKVKYSENKLQDDQYKVVIQDEQIDFYYMEDEKAIYTVSLTDDEIESIGLFSKTWEYLEHKVCFYDIKAEIK